MNPKKIERGASLATAMATKKRHEKATSNSTKGRTKAKASAKGKVDKGPTRKKVATRASIGKTKKRGRKTTRKTSYTPPAKEGPRPAATVGTTQIATLGIDRTICVSTNVEAFRWGFNAHYQRRQGNTDDITHPTRIESTAARTPGLSWAGAGVRFSFLTSVAEFEEKEEI